MLGNIHHFQMWCDVMVHLRLRLNIREMTCFQLSEDLERSISVLWIFKRFSYFAPYFPTLTPRQCLLKIQILRCSSGSHLSVVTLAELITWQKNPWKWTLYQHCCFISRSVVWLFRVCLGSLSWNSQRKPCSTPGTTVSWVGCFPKVWVSYWSI